MIFHRHIHPTLRIAIPASVLVLAACVCSTFPVTDPAPTRLPPTATTVPFGPTASPVPLDMQTFDNVPARDRYDLAARFKGITNSSPDLPASPPQVGDVQTFWVDNTQNDEVNEIKAKLVYAGDHVAMWIQEGLDYDLEDVKSSAQRFESETYPTNRAYFGSEPLPGIDDDPRVNILNNDQMGGEALGYFNSPSEYPASIVPGSNERELFYMNWDSVRPGSEMYNAILAHEFQHMIHWNIDKNEDTWVNEGMSEVAAYLNGYGTSVFASSFLFAPQTQLNAWEDDGSNAAHYGAAFLFNTYFLDRFGQDALKTLVQDPANGFQSFDTTLAGLNTGLTADDLFEDWAVANLLNDPTLGEGHYGYHDLRDLPPAAVGQVISAYPASLDDEARQFGTHYVQLTGPASLTLRFEGASQVAYLPTQIGQGDGPQGLVWWSGRADNSDMTLTREIDLAGVQDAMLDFDVWYAIEDAWDYGYVEVSPDGGRSWQILKTGASTTRNPHGNAYGPGYSGQSADQPGAGPGGWLHQQASLGLFSGQKVLIRFEQITDDAVTLPGMALDNICIQAIDWCDDVENETPGWDAEGFVRINNLAPQKYSVQVVVPADDGMVAVIPLPLDEANTGEVTVSVGTRPATLVIAGLTRHTTQTAPYHVEITQAGP